MAKKSAKSASQIGPFTTFAETPAVRFETQEKEEKVILFLRPHLITNLPWIILVTLMLLTPGVIFPLVFQHLLPTFALPIKFLIVITLFWYLATFGFALGSFIHWFFNIYIVTNERVIDIDFLYLLYKEFSEARIDKIQDISYNSSGVFAAFFNFGDVTIQTAGEKPEFDFGQVPHPERVVETIEDLIEDLKK